MRFVGYVPMGIEGGIVEKLTGARNWRMTPGKEYIDGVLYELGVFQYGKGQGNGRIQPFPAGTMDMEVVMKGDIYLVTYRTHSGLSNGLKLSASALNYGEKL